MFFWYSFSVIHLFNLICSKLKLPFDGGTTHLLAARLACYMLWQLNRVTSQEIYASAAESTMVLRPNIETPSRIMVRLTIVISCVICLNAKGNSIREDRCNHRIDSYKFCWAYDCSQFI